MINNVIEFKRKLSPQEFLDQSESLWGWLGYEASDGCDHRMVLSDTAPEIINGTVHWATYPAKCSLVHKDTYVDFEILTKQFILERSPNFKCENCQVKYYLPYLRNLEETDEDGYATGSFECKACNHGYFIYTDEEGLKYEIL